MRSGRRARRDASGWRPVSGHGPFLGLLVLRHHAARGSEIQIARLPRRYGVVVGQGEVQRRDQLQQVGADTRIAEPFGRALADRGVDGGLVDERRQLNPARAGEARTQAATLWEPAVTA